eukprot:PhF_6_TR6119/c0_g1_i1/m.9036
MMCLLFAMWWLYPLLVDGSTLEISGFHTISSTLLTAADAKHIPIQLTLSDDTWDEKKLDQLKRAIIPLDNDTFGMGQCYNDIINTTTVDLNDPVNTIVRLYLGYAMLYDPSGDERITIGKVGFATMSKLEPTVTTTNSVFTILAAHPQPGPGISFVGGFLDDFRQPNFDIPIAEFITKNFTIFLDIVDRRNEWALNVTNSFVIKPYQLLSNQFTKLYAANNKNFLLERVSDTRLSIFIPRQPMFGFVEESIVLVFARTSLKITPRVDVIPIFVNFVVEDPKKLDALKQVGQALSVTSINGASMTQAGKMSLLSDVGEKCPTDEEDEIDFVSSPVGLSFGDEKNVRLHLGAIGGNAMIVTGFLVLHVLAVVVKANMSSIPRTEAMAAVKFPGVSLLVILFFYQSLATSSLYLIAYDESIGDKIIGGVVMCLLLGVLVALYLKLNKQFRARWVAIEKDPNAPKPGVIFNAISQFTKCDSDWEDDTVQKNSKDGVTRNSTTTDPAQGFCRQYKVLFDAFRGGRQWFLLVDVSLLIPMAMVGAFHPTTSLECRNVKVLMCTLFGVYFIVAMVLQPCSTKLDSSFLLLTSLLQLTTAVLDTLAVVKHSNAYVDVSSSMILINGCFVAIKTIFDLVMKAYDIFWAKVNAGKVMGSEKFQGTKVASLTMEKDDPLNKELLATDFSVSVKLQNQKSSTFSGIEMTELPLLPSMSMSLAKPSLPKFGDPFAPKENSIPRAPKFDLKL